MSLGWLQGIRNALQSDQRGVSVSPLPDLFLGFLVTTGRITINRKE